MNRGPDRDDWFEGSEVAETQEPEAAGEDWLRDAPPPTRPWHEGVDRRIVVAAVVGIALLIAILAAAGVFSSGSPKTPAVTTLPRVTTPSVRPATTVPATSTTASTTLTAKLKPGDTGPQVRLLQQALVKLGFPAAKVDGRFGPGTEAAVEAFQTANGLPADGVVGPATRSAIAAALQRG